MFVCMSVCTLLRWTGLAWTVVINKTNDIIKQDVLHCTVHTYVMTHGYHEINK